MDARLRYRPMSSDRARTLRILLITHETSRTGAPRVATVVARGLVERGHHVHVVARTRGPLLSDFESIAPTSLEFLHRVRRRIRAIRGAGLLAFLLDTAQALGAILRWWPELVYVNSTAAAIYLRPAIWLRRRVILHVHESGTVASGFLTKARLAHIPRGVRVVACSPSVKSDFVRFMPGNVTQDIHMVPSVPDDAKVLQMSARPIDDGVASDDLVVGCCGAVELRKGADLWVQVAGLVRGAIPNKRVRFIWVGEGVPPEWTDSSEIEFIGPRENPYPYMQRFDVFTLPSRDDPFPLVVLEAMLLGRPTVAFDVGGVREQVGEAGMVIRPGDVTAFARAIECLLRDEATRRTIGDAASMRAKERYSTYAFLRSIDELIDISEGPGQVAGVQSSTRPKGLNPHTAISSSPLGRRTPGRTNN